MTTLIGLEEILRSAQPRLILRVKQVQDLPSVVMGLEPFISETDLGWDELLDEMYDATNSPLGCPVYLRTVTRAGELLSLITFLATSAMVIKGWGQKGLSYRNPDTGMTPVRLEALVT